MVKRLTYEELEQWVRELEKGEFERKIAVDAMRESEERYRGVVEDTPMLICSFLPGGEITFVNKAYCEYFTRTSEELVGSTFLSLIPEIDRETVMADISALTVDSPTQSHEHKVIAPDGEIRWQRWTNRALFDAQGKAVAFQSIGEDITKRKRAEEGLRKERERAQTYLDLAGVMFVALDAAGTVTLVNRKACEVLGYAEEQILGRNWFDTCLPQRLREEVKEVSKQLLRGEIEPLEYYENPVLTKRGTERLVAWHNTFLRDDKGAIIGHLSSGEDITNRKRAEDALREERNFSASLLQSSPTFFVAVNATGQTLMMNETMLKSLGYEKDEVLGTNYLETFVPEDDRKSLLNVFNNLVDLNKVVQNESHVVTKDGRELIVEWHTRPMPKEDGELDYFFSVGIDIAERKQSEIELRESEERFRAIFEGSLDAIFLANPESGDVIDANPAAEELLLRKREEIIQLHPSRLRPAHLKSSVEKILSKHTRGEDVDLPIETSVLRSDGREIPVEILAHIIQIDGVPVFYATFRDITERKRMGEETARVERLESLGILAGGIAHDFNNILTPILTNISMAKAYGELNDEIDDLLTDAEKATLRAKGLSQQLLTFSRGGAPVKKPTSMSKLLMDTVKFALSGSNVRSEYSIREDLWPCEIDEGQIGQVIHNMVINADQAMLEGGTIKISAENVWIDRTDSLPLEDGRYVKIFITDQGIGIPGRHLTKIFDPFYTTKEKGSGLGLSTSYSVVKRHDGTIRVESELGVGTTFYVYLPASAREAGVGEAERQKPPRGKGNILVVDDDEGVRRALEKVLKRLGYGVELAKDGAEGVGVYEKAIEGKRPFDVVIMDLTIPGGMGGREGIRELKRIDPDARVVVSSGYSEDPVMSEFREYGFVGVVKKPYKIEDLGEVLAKVIAGERG